MPATIKKNQNRNKLQIYIAVFGHRKFYAICGFILAQGAPIGYLLHTFLFKSMLAPESLASDFYTHTTQIINTQMITLAYIWCGTTLYFTLFGWLMGEYAAKLYWQNKSLQHSMRLLEKFEAGRRKLFLSMSAELKTPAVTAQEFLMAFSQGELGLASADHQQMARAATVELKTLNKTLDKLFTVIEKQHHGLKNISAKSVAQEISTKSKSNLEYVANQEAVLWIEPKLLTDTVVEMFAQLKRTHPKNELHLKVENASNENYVDHPFIYLVLESRGQTYGNAWQSDWMLVQNTIEWLGGHSWFDSQYTGGVKLYLAFPEAHGEKKSA